jgi:hypothetical protein
MLRQLGSNLSPLRRRLPACERGWAGIRVWGNIIVWPDAVCVHRGLKVYRRQRMIRPPVEPVFIFVKQFGTMLRKSHHQYMHTRGYLKKKKKEKKKGIYYFIIAHSF